MKKKIFIALASCFCLIVLLSSKALAAGEKNESCSPVKFSLWPGIWGIPSDSNIYGVNFGLVTFGKKVNGADMALFLSQTETVKGLRMSITNFDSKKSKGLELALC